jgi:hypothetical protein
MSVAACGSDSGDSGGGKVVIGNDFGLAFSPIFTATDGQHDFKVPIVSQGGVAIDKWQIVDKGGAEHKEVGDFVADANVGGAMFTAKKAGDYYVVAHAGKQTGCAEIHITAATPAQWTAGEARYNNSIMLTSLVPTGMTPMLPKDISCKNCHGEGAEFLAVEHTPQQTAGYSDDDLKKILTMGMKPTPPDPSVPADCTPYAYMPSKTGVPLALYRFFHTWQASDEEQAGLVVYLRSLAPLAQGMLDFGGLTRPTGAAAAPVPADPAAGGAAGSAP